jgi:hypothetical protein
MAASSSTTTPSNAPSAPRVTRKNALSAGSDGGAEHWATVASLIETCKLNDVDPEQSVLACRSILRGTCFFDQG